MTAGARVHCVVLDTRTGNPGQGAPPSGVRDRAGGHGGRETPGPIPNPEVKPSSADGTARGSVWESRKPPDHTTIPAGGREPHQGPPPPAGGQPFNNHTSTRHPTRQPGPPDNRAADRQDPHPRPNHRQHHPTRPRTSHPNTTTPPTTNQTHRPDGADPLVHLCSSSHSSIGSLRSRAGRKHEQVIGSFERSGASS